MSGLEHMGENKDPSEPNSTQRAAFITAGKRPAHVGTLPGWPAGSEACRRPTRRASRAAFQRADGRSHASSPRGALLLTRI